MHGLNTYSFIWLYWFYLGEGNNICPLLYSLTYLYNIKILKPKRLSKYFKNQDLGYNDILIVLKAFFYNNLICYVFVSINLKQTFRIFKILFCSSENQTEVNLEIIIEFQTLLHNNT